MPNKSTIIVSDLTKEDCLTLPKVIKQELLQNLGSDCIDHWSELFGLSRLVIVLRSELLAFEAISLIKKNYPSIKVHLSESILPRHKSVDGLEAPTTPELHLYREPVPIYSKEAHAPTTEKQKTLLEPLTLDTKSDSDDGGSSPKSPRITLEYD